MLVNTCIVGEQFCESASATDKGDLPGNAYLWNVLSYVSSSTRLAFRQTANSENSCTTNTYSVLSVLDKFNQCINTYSVLSILNLINVLCVVLPQLVSNSRYAAK
jgi:hypothetical protein